MTHYALLQSFFEVLFSVAGCDVERPRPYAELKSAEQLDRMRRACGLAAEALVHACEVAKEPRLTWNPTLFKGILDGSMLHALFNGPNRYLLLTQDSGSVFGRVMRRRVLRSVYV